MTLQNWEFSYNGLLFGGATQYGVVRVEGLDPPNIKVDVREKVSRHGSFVYARFYSERRVIITGDIVPTSGLPEDLEPLVNTWRTTFAPQSADLPLLYKLPGVAVRRINCRPARASIVKDARYELGVATWIVELVAGDPAIYNEAGTIKLFEG